MQNLDFYGEIFTNPSLNKKSKVNNIFGEVELKWLFMNSERFAFSFKNSSRLKGVRIAIIFGVLVLGVHFCTPNNSNAQTKRWLRSDTTIPKKLPSSFNWPTDALNFMGIVILNGKVVKNSIKTLDSLSVDSLRSCGFFRRPPVDSVIKYGLAARNGILIINTIKASSDSLFLPWKHKSD